MYSQAPSGDCFREDRWGGARVEAIALIQAGDDGVDSRAGEMGTYS